MPRDPLKTKALRDSVIDISGGQCEWPRCGDSGQEMAHVISRGAGGPDSLGNVAWLCRPHHWTLDGGHVTNEYKNTQLALLGVPYYPGRPGTHVAARTALARHLTRNRPPTEAEGLSVEGTREVTPP